MAAIWVNEKIYPLSYNRSKAYAISTRGQEIYVAGDVENKAAYWKGIEEQLPIQLNKNNNSHAYAIFANDKDVLIAGSRGSQTPAIWDQTGKETAISTTGADNISSIFISGDDVYIGGTSYSTNPQNKKFVATYWKNNKAHQLTDGTRTGHAFDESAANSVYVKGQDVYVAGNLQVKTAKEIATVWKVQAGKTEEILLTNSSAEPAVARSIVVDNKNSMHVSGYHRFNKTYKVATLWVDGKPTYLADKNVNSEAYGVFVKE